MNEREAYIALNLMDKVGPVMVRALCEELGSIEAIFDAAPEVLRRAKGVGKRVADAIVSQRDRIPWQREIERAEAGRMRLVTPVDVDYPEVLKAIHDPPLALYVRGALQARDAHAVAVVGTRRPTHYGRETAARMAGGLARAGYTVVSGLARGVDAVAHEAALKAKGRTVAVIGSGMACLYPPAHLELATRIAEHGAVLSEFPLDRQPDKTTFPMRNRIVSGLSRGVVVVEAGRRSGALITADSALEQGRDVFAVPGRVDCERAEGCHALIRKGAALVRNAEDVIEEYGSLWGPSAPEVAGDKATQALTDDEAVLVGLLEDGPRPVDDLIRESGLAAAAIGGVLIGLEMKRAVRMLPGRMVERRT